MNAIVALLQSINDSAVAETIRGSFWVFPALETVHVLAIVFVLGSIARLDLRLMGLVLNERAVTQVSDEMLPYTWAAFGVATLFGIALWASKPLGYLGMAFFDVKMILILLAGLNMIVFQRVTFRAVGLWDRDPIPPGAVRFAGYLSMAFWVSVVVCGRFIGFV